MNSFTTLPISPEIQKNLQTLGFQQPTEIQTKAISLLLENLKQDVHAQAQTGTGKTLAFGIPLLHAIDINKRIVQGLVVAPTRELVLQIYESLKAVSAHTGIAIEPIYGGMPINQQITNIKRGAQIIIGTPGRLNDHLRRKTLSLSALSVLVLDEADIMLDMGFKEEIDEILQFAPKNRQIWLFSATVRPGIKEIIKSHMANVSVIKAATPGLVSSQVEQYYCVVPMRKRVDATARFIEATPNFYGIIFCQTKLLASEVMEQLASKGFKVNCLHGDMKQTVRNQVIKGFKNKDFNILVATDVAARGIDVSDLTHVINFSIPNEFENYVHRIGRTGRAGKEGIAIVFVQPNEQYRIKRLERSANTKLQEISIPSIEAVMQIKMVAISDFIEQSKKPLEKLSSIHASLKETISSFTPAEIQQAFAVALETIFFKDIAHEEISPISSNRVSDRAYDRGNDEETIDEICVEVGTDNKCNEKMVRNYLADICNVAGNEILKVRVIKKKTFISLTENRLRECLQTIQTNPITHKRVKAYIVKDTKRPMHR
ncbi:MAG: DEAD/DEAH box helicase [Candidatus Babeliales bacterium]